jgi:hypothetical protein
VTRNNPSDMHVSSSSYQEDCDAKQSLFFDQPNTIWWAIKHIGHEKWKDKAWALFQELTADGKLEPWMKAKRKYRGPFGTPPHTLTHTHEGHSATRRALWYFYMYAYIMCVCVCVCVCVGETPLHAAVLFAGQNYGKVA